MRGEEGRRARAPGGENCPAPTAGERQRVAVSIGVAVIRPRPGGLPGCAGSPQGRPLCPESSRVLLPRLWAAGDLCLRGDSCRCRLVGSGMCVCFHLATADLLCLQEME